MTDTLTRNAVNGIDLQGLEAMVESVRANPDCGSAC